MKFTHIALISSVGMLSLGTIAPLQAVTIVPTYVSGAGGNSGSYTGASSNDHSEITAQTATAGAMVVFNFGAVTTFSDLSITSNNTTSAFNPNNFEIQVQAVDDPNATTGWTTIATASNIFGALHPTATTFNAGRRLEFTPQIKQYFRYVNTDANTETFQELQVGRPVVITSAGAAGTSTARIMNRAADGQSADPSTFRYTGLSGSFDFDALLPTGQGVKAITLQHGDATSSIASSTFPTGTVTILDSNDPTFATYNSTNFTLNSTEAAGAIYTLTYANPVNSRYFQFQWNNVVTPTATSTQFAEVGITTAAVVPEPATISLVAGAGLLLLRRRRSQGC